MIKKWNYYRTLLQSSWKLSRYTPIQKIILLFKCPKKVINICTSHIEFLDELFRYRKSPETYPKKIEQISDLHKCGMNVWPVCEFIPHSYSNSCVPLAVLDELLTWCTNQPISCKSIFSLVVLRKLGVS